MKTHQSTHLLHHCALRRRCPQRESGAENRKKLERSWHPGTTSLALALPAPFTCATVSLHRSICAFLSPHPCLFACLQMPARANAASAAVQRSLLPPRWCVIGFVKLGSAEDFFYGGGVSLFLSRLCSISVRVDVCKCKRGGLAMVCTRFFIL